MVWSSDRALVTDSSAFLFSLSDELIYYPNGDSQIEHNPTWGPSFMDVVIRNNSNQHENNIDNIGKWYGEG